MSSPVKKVELFALSTCGWCRKTKEWLDTRRVTYHVVYMDQIFGEERDTVAGRILQFTDQLSFPVLMVDDGKVVIQGYQPERFEDVLG